VVRATKYPITDRGGKGYVVLQRGSLEAIVHDEARPVPGMEEVGE
jgi:DNA gyrase subunit A